MDRRRLLPDTGFARFARLCNVASGDFDAYPGISPPMGPAQADRTLDNPNLAVRLGHRRACVLDALQMVSSGAMIQDLSAVTDSLALGNDLMFDHTMRCCACEKNHGDYCDVQ